MDPSQFVKILGAYCERGGDPSFWAEPINAITNGAFLIAALVIAGQHGTRPAAERTFDVWLLALITFAIGVGSFLFHTYAERWAATADVAPIGLFILVYFAFAMSRFAACPPGLAILLIGAYFGAAAYLATLGQPGVRFAGSLAYVPALALMPLFGIVCLIRRHPAALGLFAATAVFAVSLTLRTIDKQICGDIQFAGAPLGTHFLWHLLNAVTLYLLMRTAMLHWNHDRVEAGLRAP